MSENILICSEQWASRSPDERFWDIPEFEAAMKDRESRQVELSTTIDKIAFSSVGEKGLVLTINCPQGSIEAEMNNLAFTQMSRRLEYPTRGLDPELISTEMIANILNQRVERMDPETSVMFLLEANDDASVITAKSVTSDAYARLNNSACAPFLRKIASFGYRFPPARPVGFENERTRAATEQDILKNNKIGGGLEIRVGDLICPSGLYAGDEDFFAFMVADDDDNLVEDENGTSLMQGFMLRNSSVGVGSFNLTTFIMQGICGNHIIWGAKDIIDIQYKHIGSAVERITKTMGSLTNNSNKEYLDNIRLSMNWMVRNRIGDNVTEVIDNVRHMLSRKHPVLTEKLLFAAYANAAQFREQDGDPNTYQGFMNAITRYSQTLPFQNVRKEIDKAASALIGVAQQQMGKE